MAKKDPRIDAYIAKAKPFAQPILKHYRELVHKTCPGIEEKMKWSFPHFDYKNEMMTSMAAFKEHCAISYWKAALMKDHKKMSAKQQTAMGHMGKITSVNDLPSDKILIAYIKEAMKLNDEGKKLPPREIKAGKEPLSLPPYFKKALSQNKKALAHFENFAPGQKKEYILWLSEAKTEETRNKRMEQAIEWISEGKIRNWKYVR